MQNSRGLARNTLIDRTVAGVLSLCVLMTLVTTLTVVGILGKESLSFFSHVSLFG